MLGKTRLAWLVLAVFLGVDALLFLSVLTAPPPSLTSTAEYLAQNPMLRPGFIMDLSTSEAQVMHLERAMSVAINAAPFARAGTSADGLVEYLLDNYRMTVDGAVVRTETFSYLLLSCRTPDVCYGGPIIINFDVSGLTPGLHLAEITVTDLEGIPHSFSWAFRIG